MKMELVNIEDNVVDNFSINGKNIKKKNKILIISIVIMVIFAAIICILELKFGIIKKLININSFYVETENDSKYIGVGETLDLNIVNSFGNINNDSVKWVSSNEEIADISEGKIKGLSVGNVDIYAVVDNKKSKELQLECLVKVQDIQLDLENIVLPIRSSEKINTTVYPENSTYKELIWSSSDEKIATVKDGVVCAKSAGKCEISVADITGSVIKKCNVEVINIESDMVVLDEEFVELSKGENYIISEKIYPEETTNKEVKWESTDENVITVDNGTIYAVNYGQADVIVTTSDGKTAKCTFSVAQNSKSYDIRYCKSSNYTLKQKPDDKSEDVVNLNRNDVLQVLAINDNWTKVRTPGGEVGYIKNSAYTIEKSYLIDNVPFLDQMELGYPTGCEAVSATMVAQFYGYDVLPEDVIENTPTDERGIWTEQVEKEVEVVNEENISVEEESIESVEENIEETQEDNKKMEKVVEEVLYGSNPFEVFVGHPAKDYDEGSYGCYAPPIITALNRLNIKCSDISGCSQEELLNYISQGIPIVVWGTYNGRDIVYLDEWTYPDNSGSYVNLKGEHCMVLIGYDDYKVYLNDPIAGKKVTQTKEQFFKNWDILYRQAIQIYK